MKWARLTRDQYISICTRYIIHLFEFTALAQKG